MEIDVIFGGIWYLVKEGGMENGVESESWLKFGNATGGNCQFFWFAEDPNSDISANARESGFARLYISTNCKRRFGGCWQQPSLFIYFTNNKTYCKVVEDKLKS